MLGVIAIMKICHLLFGRKDLEGRVQEKGTRVRSDESTKKGARVRSDESLWLRDSHYVIYYNCLSPLKSRCENGEMQVTFSPVPAMVFLPLEYKIHGRVPSLGF